MANLQSAATTELQKMRGEVEQLTKAKAALKAALAYATRAMHTPENKSPISPGKEPYVSAKQRATNACVAQRGRGTGQGAARIVRKDAC